MANNYFENDPNADPYDPSGLQRLDSGIPLRGAEFGEEDGSGNRRCTNTCAAGQIQGHPPGCHCFNSPAGGPGIVNPHGRPKGRLPPRNRSFRSPWNFSRGR